MGQPDVPPDAHPVTLADVAREAGVSPATASRVLHPSGVYVSEAATSAVKAAADRLGYVRTRSAPKGRTVVVEVPVTVERQVFVSTVAGATGFVPMRQPMTLEDAIKLAAARNDIAQRTGQPRGWRIYAVTPVGTRPDPEPATRKERRK